MKIKKYEITILLLFLTFSMQLDAYGQLPENEIGQSYHRRIRDHSMYGRFTELMTEMLSLTPNVPSAPHTSNRSISGRKNPFTPLTKAKRITRNTKDEASTVSRTPQAKPEPCPVARLTTTFTVTDSRKNRSTAIVEESGISRFVSVGDTIVGMTIVEIQRGKVILSKGDKKCVVKLEFLSEVTGTKEL